MIKPVRVVAVSLAAALSLPAGLPLAVGTSAAAAASVAVIVQAPGAEARVAEAVRELGGAVTRALPIVNGFAALLPADAVDELEAEPGVRAVTPDARMEPTGAKESLTATTTTTSSTNTSTIKSVYRQEVGADQLSAAGATGAGVTVALIDTGVTEVPDLAGKLLSVDDPMVKPTAVQPDPPDVPCVNFSGEATCDDTFGHGTFMAGLIAGNGASSGGRYSGVAPGAKIVSVKVGGKDGSADVSKVLAAIQWAVSFKDHDDYNIKVLNLSMGTDSTQDPSIDPLNLAVQRAWATGLTVVVSAGNFGRGERTRPDGSTYGTVTKPGDDPFVITVGAVDDRESPGLDDDRGPHFSSWGPTYHGLAKPDVVAPGARVVSLRAPGSFIDSLPGVIDGSYRRGSGTSMAAAVTSGLAAQLLDARDGSDGKPAWRPDDVKAALIAGARKVNVRETRAIGAGLVYGPNALAAAISPVYRTSAISDGSGSLDGSRGTNKVDGDACAPVAEPFDDCGLLDDDETAQGNNWQAEQYAQSQWTPETWYESQWVTAFGNNWQGNNWQGSSWNDQVDDRSYGTTTRGSGSYGAWG